MDVIWYLHMFSACSQNPKRKTLSGPVNQSDCGPDHVAKGDRAKHYVPHLYLMTKPSPQKGPISQLIQLNSPPYKHGHRCLGKEWILSLDIYFQDLQPRLLLIESSPRTPGLPSSQEGFSGGFSAGPLGTFSACFLLERISKFIP